MSHETILFRFDLQSFLGYSGSMYSPIDNVVVLLLITTVKSLCEQIVVCDAVKGFDTRVTLFNG